jgi:hypothetical protein
MCLSGAPLLTQVGCDAQCVWGKKGLPLFRAGRLAVDHTPVTRMEWRSTTCGACSVAYLLACTCFDDVERHLVRLVAMLRFLGSAGLEVE